MVYSFGLVCFRYILSFGRIGTSREAIGAVDAVDSAAGTSRLRRWWMMVMMLHSAVSCTLVGNALIVQAAVDLHGIRLIDGLLLTDYVWY